MTDKQIEEKALKAYPPEYEQEDFDETWDINKQYREPYIKALKEIESLPKIKGCVAEAIYFTNELIKQLQEKEEK